MNFKKLKTMKQNTPLTAADLVIGQKYVIVDKHSHTFELGEIVTCIEIDYNDEDKGERPLFANNYKRQYVYAKHVTPYIEAKEITDEDIERASLSYIEEGVLYSTSEAFIAGVNWYKEQLNKQ